MDIERETTALDNNAEEYADELSKLYERQSRRYSITLDCGNEEE